MDRKLLILPQPQNIVWLEGAWLFKERLTYYVEQELAEPVADYLEMLICPSAVADDMTNAAVAFRHNRDLGKQAYKLGIRHTQIEIEYEELRGIYYALVTLNRIIKQYGDEVPCLEIGDHPDFEVRGVMLDISRDRIPTLDTLYRIVDMLSLLKINHFELYIEGFAFAYPSFKALWKDETPLTGEEIRKLDRYCKKRFIDLVPNQNCLGHMAQWLATDEFKALAECEEGIQLYGRSMPPTTLDPTNEESIALIRRMTEDLLPNFTSEYFNVNLDEPFELGKGKSKQTAEKIGLGQLYIDYVKKIHGVATQHGKRMLMWGDVISGHKEAISQIPRDVIVLEWGYEADHPFKERGEALKASGLDFYMCPGTSGWSSVGGRTDNMLSNISSAVCNGKEFGAKGILMTDWGDNGHWQPVPVSYAGYSYGAALSWNAKSKGEIRLAEYLDRYVYDDRNEVMGEFSLALGRYNEFEDFLMSNMTLSIAEFMFGLIPKTMHTMIIENYTKTILTIYGGDQESLQKLEQRIDQRKEYDYNGLCRYLDNLQTMIRRHGMKCEDAAIVEKEYVNAMDIIRVGADLRHFIDQEENLSSAQQEILLQRMNTDLTRVIDEYKRLWVLRSKEGGLNRSIGMMMNLRKQIDEKLKAF